MTFRLKIKQLRERWSRLFGYARRSIARDKITFLATGLVLIIMVFVCNIIFSLHFITDNILAYVHQKADFYVEVQDDADNFYIQSLLSDLKQHEGVTEISYISKDDALLQFQETFPDSGLMSFLNRYNEPNPLPASIGIATDNLAYQASILTFLQDAKFEKVVDPQSIAFQSEQTERNAKILSFSGFITRTGWILIIVFTISAFLIVFNTISANLRHRSQEIEIMYLVGAKHSSIRLPFVIEGVILSLASVLLANFLLLFFLSNIYDRGLTLFQNQELNRVVFNSIRFISSNFAIFVTVELLLVLGFAIAISYSAIYRYFRRVYAQ